MVGRCIPYWNGPNLGDMLVFGAVYIRTKHHFTAAKQATRLPNLTLGEVTGLASMNKASWVRSHASTCHELQQVFTDTSNIFTTKGTHRARKGEGDARVWIARAQVAPPKKKDGTYFTSNSHEFTNTKFKNIDEHGLNCTNPKDSWKYLILLKIH